MRRFIASKFWSSEVGARLSADLHERRELLNRAEQVALNQMNCIERLEDKEERQALRSEVLTHLLPHEVREPYCKFGKESPLLGCVSFRQQLAVRSARSQMGGVCPEWKLNNKIKSARFVREIGFPIPKHFGTFRLNSAPNLTNRVIKPHYGAGSKGVFLVGAEQALDVFTLEMLDVSELPERMGKIKAKKWIVEELISASASEPIPATDLKFYCFYGEVALVLEVDRYPQRKYCWWDANGRRISTGKYQDDEFEGVGYSSEALAMARTISLAIPAPFCRIDLLRGHDRTVFGEITPRPGGFQDFNAETDFRLGKEFMQAEGRLQQDLLKGKSFHSLFLS